MRTRTMNTGGSEPRMMPRVKAITSHIVDRLAAAAVADMQARYDFGQVLHSVQVGDPGENWLSALRAVSERLGVDESALRRYRRVSERIDAREFAWLTSLRTDRGWALKWSHIELLARVGEKSRRRDLAMQIVAEDLTVRALAARL